jgi:hypothetical protein
MQMRQKDNFSRVAIGAFPEFIGCMVQQAKDTCNARKKSKRNRQDAKGSK